MTKSSLSNFPFMHYAFWIKSKSSLTSLKSSRLSTMFFRKFLQFYVLYLNCFLNNYRTTQTISYWMSSDRFSMKQSIYSWLLMCIELYTVSPYLFDDFRIYYNTPWFIHDIVNLYLFFSPFPVFLKFVYFTDVFKELALCLFFCILSLFSDSLIFFLFALSFYLLWFILLFSRL